MIDLSGQKFERLTIVSRCPNNKHRIAMWLCVCDCGKETIVAGTRLRSGRTKSCGCLNLDNVKKRFTKHGHTKGGKWSKIYKSWVKMIQRCTNPNNKDYHYYGGRGITVCERWRKFTNFLEDIGKRPTRNHSIDRINNDGNYCKSNCRWATRKQQARNRRDNHLITHNGKTQCLPEWAEEFSMSKETLRKRVVNLGWSIKRALVTPTTKNKH